MAWPEFCFILLMPQTGALLEVEARLFAELPAQRRWPEAVIFFEGLLAVRPGFLPAVNALALVAYENRDYDAALRLLAGLHRREPKNIFWLNNLGVVLAARGECSGAWAMLGRALKLAPAHAEILYNRACLAIVEGRAELALELLRATLACFPEHRRSLFGLSRLAKENGLLAESVACCRRLCDKFPENAEYRFNLGLMLLKVGAWEEGFTLYESRPPVGGLKNLAAGEKLWRGEPLAGKTMLVIAEQGLGDTIICARYLPLLERLKAGLTVAVQEPLLELLRNSFPELEIPAANQKKSSSYDYRISLLSLPHRFRTRLDNLPAVVPYLKVSTAARERWSSRLSRQKNGCLKIGVVWASNPINLKEKRRALPLSLFSRLFAVAGAVFFSLKKDQEASDLSLIDKLPAELRSRYVDLAPELTDLHETAAIMENLDLIISCDTSVPHLAGALARPVWLLLPFDADWRWLVKREDSPWYPTMRLFR
ncbi:MAG: tetratricopeptide repeat protein, partial [Deltaproteobacteria bacterium]|nr:tetratricopeptide repeat protein [Deltaproteobacteria bacterium]